MGATEAENVEQDFAAADAKLTNANTNAARKRHFCAFEGTRESAADYDLAAERAHQVGQDYLEARFRHDAMMDGCFVPDDYFDEPVGNPRDELPPPTWG